MRHGIETAKTAGFACILLVGDEAYYQRVGFSRLAPGCVRLPGPVDKTRILGLALAQDALQSLEGEITRARIDNPICADSAPLG